MISKHTWMNVSDNTNVKWLQTFHLYKGFHRKVSYPGLFIKGAAKSVEPPRIEYKGFKIKFNKKGDVCRGIIIRAAFKLKKPDSSTLLFPQNSMLLIKKKQEFKSKYLFGPISYLIKRKRLTSVFRYII